VVETAGVVETTKCITTRPEDDSDGGVVEMTECITTRPEDDSDGESDGEPDSEGLVQSPKDDSDGDPNGDLIPIGGVGTEGLINRPEDGSDGEPITIGAAVGLNTEGFTNRPVSSHVGITIGAALGVVDTKCFTNRLKDGSYGGSDGAPITI
jgi:hypothetical protein